MNTKKMIVTNYCEKTNMYRLQEVNPPPREKNYGEDVLFVYKEKNELELNLIYTVSIPELSTDVVYIELESSVK